MVTLIENVGPNKEDISLDPSHIICQLSMGIITKDPCMEDCAEQQSDLLPERKEPLHLKRCSTLRVCLKQDWEANLERSLLRSLCVARNQYRIRLGLSQSLRVLEMNPRSVLLCILPIDEHDGDSLSHVQVLLIEAYCNENSIRLLKVYSPENLWNIVKHNNETDIEDEEGGFEDEDDGDCDDGIVLILKSQPESSDDDLLRGNFDIATELSNGPPIVRLTG